MKKIFIILGLFFFTGCMKYQDLQDLAIIKSIGIKKEDKYTLYAEIIEEIDKDNKPQMQVYEVTSEKLENLFEDIKILVNKEIYLSHIDLLLFDINLTKDDYQNIIHTFLHNQELRNDFYCVLASDIKEVLTKEKYDEIEELIKTNNDNKKVINLTFETLIKNILDNKMFTISKVALQDKQIIFDGNYHFKNGKLERINTNEKKQN